MYQNCCNSNMDYGPDPYVANIERLALQNQNFRTAIWTGDNLQMTVMCIQPCDEIGMEVHECVDQFIRVEQGIACAQMGNCKYELDFQKQMCTGDAVFVPAGMWHNVKNIGKMPLKLSVIYAPPNHERGTVHKTKKTANI